MADQRRRRTTDVDEMQLRVGAPEDHAAGLKAVTVSAKRSLERMGPARTARTWLKLNQADGFDCMSCAWPDPDPEHRHTAEFCENGAKAVAEEATTRRATPQFFAEHSIAELDGHSEYWLGQQGRITQPMIKGPGGTHYEPIGWSDAFKLIGDQLNTLGTPDEALFYTSGRTSNEAAFVYQLFVRAYGTNNLPDCSNMCHESTSIALQESIGIGKASVTLDDVYNAQLLILAGQNPGTNHPRMLSALEIAKQRGAKIISINPLREAGLINFRNPQKPRGLVGHGTDLADLYLPIKINGDLALFQAFGSLLVKWDALDHAFIAPHTRGFEAWRAHVAALDWDFVVETTGLSRELITEAAQLLRDSTGTVFCWAMGLTQHHNSVAAIKEISNVAFAQGNIGKPGAGLLPVRGHSNVQGDRTMGIWERPPAHFLDALQAEFGFDPPRAPGYDTVDAIRALRDGEARVFIGLGGNFVQAAPDTDVTTDALRNAALTVQISTKINRSHLVCGDTALILPTLGRTEVDLQVSGPQFVTVEDSMCAVHASRGPLKPASQHLRSEVAIITGIAEATLGNRHGIQWAAMRDDYRRVRHHIANVIHGCESYETKVGLPDGFVMPIRHVTPAPSPPTPGWPSSLSPPLRPFRSRTATLSFRPCAATTSTTPPSTGSATAIAASRAVATSSSSTRATSNNSASPTGMWSISSRTGLVMTTTAVSRTSASSPTTPPAEAPPPITRKPTRWCRSTPPPPAATRRHPNRSSSDWKGQSDTPTTITVDTKRQSAPMRATRATLRR